MKSFTIESPNDEHLREEEAAMNKKKLLKVPSDVGKETKKQLVARGNDPGSTTRRHFYHYLSRNQKTLIGVVLAMIMTMVVAYILYGSRTTTSYPQQTTSNITDIGHPTTTTTTTTTKNDDRTIPMTPKDAFLAWFVRNGGVYHPIQIGESGNDTVNVTINEFPTFGGWGLAVNIPSSSSSALLLPAEEECTSSSSSTTEVDNADVNADDQQCKKMTKSNEQQQQQQQQQSILIRHLDPLFTVPSSLIITVQSIIEIYGKVDSIYYLSTFIPTMNTILDQNFPHYQGMLVGRGGGGMGLTEQDVIIATYLMVEDCYYHHLVHQQNNNNNHHVVEDSSYWGEYLDILPQYSIPRLDTFTTVEYEALNDTLLEWTGRESRHVLEKIFTNNYNANNSDGSSNGQEEVPILQTLVRDLMYRKLGISSTTTTTTTATTTTIVPESCISFDTFHRFVGIVSSRAMVLKGVKYLTPLAEMINYSPKEVEGPSLPFDLYHTLNQKDNSITVRSDRNVYLPSQSSFQEEVEEGDDSSVVITVQLFEDYGPVDNSLFLSAHGFVPFENPNNCATISGSAFLRRHLAPGRRDENIDLLYRALKSLHLIHPDMTKFEELEDVCVKANLDIVDDGNDIGRRPASDSIAIISLLLGDSESNPVWARVEEVYDTFTSLRDKCIAAINSNDTERMEVRCARYPDNKQIVKEALRKAAVRMRMNFNNNNNNNNNNDDGNDNEDKLLSQLQHAEAHNMDRLALALRFRLDERNVLDQVINSATGGGLWEQQQHHRPASFFQDYDGIDISLNPNSVDDDNSNQDILEMKLIEFTKFIDALGLPVKKIEPKLLTNGMRIGAFATEELNLNDVYIALPVNSVIDVTTALVVDERNQTTQGFISLMKKFAHISQGNGGFDALLLYLLHERYIHKVQSRWWPYLALLPTVEELSTYHPLFFNDDEIDRYLSGSDVRGYILRYQRHASERYKALSSDLDVNLVLGDIILDKSKVLWATAILDSRSIWWNGNRHLVPLLDLVNADNNGEPHKTRLDDRNDDDSHDVTAVTVASRHVMKGDQIFENYGQPNYLLFTYHGFILDENSNDCALIDRLSINNSHHHRHQKAVSPAFCISGNIESLSELAQFLRTNYGIAQSSNNGIDDVRSYIAKILEERIARLTEALLDSVNVDEWELPRVRFMRQIVNNDLIHFRQALDVVTTYEE